MIVIVFSFQYISERFEKKKGICFSDRWWYDMVDEQTVLYKNNPGIVGWRIILIFDLMIHLISL